MPPTPNNVDGIKPPAVAPTGPPLRPPEEEPKAETQSEQPTANGHNTVDLKAEAAAAAQPQHKAPPRVSKKSRGPLIPVLITLIVMVILIGLAYSAYNKTK